MSLSSREIRSRFLSFFEERGHRVVPSAGLVPESDPTLLFTNAGMVPFKRVFLGEEQRDYTRAASSQKCMRVSGKHNDLENVGRTPRHHTFFEMLGNFSFGDYFKEDAIAFAWEFVTETLGIPGERLVVSVFRDDDEAYALWRDRVGLPEEKIFRLDEEENFWSMGETGPCGPCSEIHYDYGANPEVPDDDPSSDSGRFLEIWNLVFMQFNRDAGGTMEPLPAPCVDTGAGLERLAAVLQGVPSNYDTDLFQGILESAQVCSGVRLGEDESKDVSLRVVADHARAVSFLLADGVLPANEGRGYVLRRILRRAARHGVLLGMEEPFLHIVSGAVVDEMGEAYPELAARREYIAERIQREEERFLETLSKGLVLLEDEVRRVRDAGQGRLPGEVVFRLYDTYGFPVDLTEDILRGESLEFDRAGFDVAMDAQRERARAAWKGSGDARVSGAYNDLAARFEVRFRGYETLAVDAPIAALLVDGATAPQAEEGQGVEVIVEETPFYPEGGGQVGDRGVIATESGEVDVEDTARPLEGLIVHRGRVRVGSVGVDQDATLRVDPEHRDGAIRHHSGTHVLHAALREVLGPNATQRGSLVTPGRLRFDFSHDAPVTREELERIEDLSNAWIAQNAPARVETIPYREAIEAGAVAMFGEKYGDEVRVVSFGEFSKELCGGTHARTSGEIGVLKVISEGGVASGVRRIEALTGREALARWRRDERQLEGSAALLRVPRAEVVERIEKLLEERRDLERDLERLRTAQRAQASGDLASQSESIGGVQVLLQRVDGVAGKGLRELVDQLRDKLGSGIVMLAAPGDGKVALALGVTPDLVERFPAKELIRDASSHVGGKGGGRPDFAQAGGPNIAGIDAAFAAVREVIVAGNPS